MWFEQEGAENANAIEQKIAKDAKKMKARGVSQGVKDSFR